MNKVRVTETFVRGKRTHFIARCEDCKQVIDEHYDEDSQTRTNFVEHNCPVMHIKE